MNSFLASQIRDIAAELILDALENGDAIKTAQELREEIRQGWLAALDQSGVPTDIIKTLQFPI
jgi:Mg/Co/Ni transporter MgtE